MRANEPLKWLCEIWNKQSVEAFRVKETFWLRAVCLETLFAVLGMWEELSISLS